MEPRDDVTDSTAVRSADAVRESVGSSTPNPDCIEACFDAYSMMCEQCGDIPDPGASQACMNAANASLDACLARCGGGQSG